MSKSTRPSVAPDLYDERYYTLCEGYKEFAREGGGLPPRLKAALALADVQQGARVLDVGCGRGEVAVHCAARGAYVWGIDYARAAVEIAHQTLAQTGGETARMAAVQIANAKRLPFADATFDRVLMLDLVEHLYPWELELALIDTYRVLKPDGRLVIHTMPNRWYYRFGYPIFRMIKRLGGERLPRNPRARSEYNVHVHVNEQDVIRLRRVLKRCGFVASIRLENFYYGSLGNGRVGAAVNRLVRLPGLRLFLCNDILAVARKEV